MDLYGALMRPRLKNSIASAESRLLPTYDPLMVIILITDSKTGARRYAPAGRPIATTVSCVSMRLVTNHKLCFESHIWYETRERIAFQRTCASRSYVLSSLLEWFL